MAHNESSAQKESISVPDSGDHSKRGKGKMIADLWKRCVDVEDLAAERISLPACLVEPVPNLEYWCYLDRPDLFVAINDSEDRLQRMLSVIRFCFSKDLKLAVCHSANGCPVPLTDGQKGEPFKPYDSFPGEYFRAYVDVPTDAINFASTDSSEAPVFSWHLDKVDTASSPVVTSPNDSFGAKSEPSTRAGAKEGSSDSHHHRVVYLKEKVSDNPPISAYWFECLSKGVEASGVDHISASTNVFGSAIEVLPGSQNKGIFLRIKKGPGYGESYRITHPTGIIKGLISGQPYVVITDSTIITCSGRQGQQLRTIIEYKDQPSSKPPTFEVEGTIFAYKHAPGHETWTKVQQVPSDLVVATFKGCWKGEITWETPDSDRTWPLIDLSQLAVVPKQVRHVREQLPNESRRFWDPVTTNILDKKFSEATRTKQTIEQEQQAISNTRKQFGIRFYACYFGADISSGAPTLSSKGRRILMEETPIFHESPASSTEESPIQQSHEPASAKSPEELWNALKDIFTRKKRSKREKERKDSIEDDRKSLPTRKKKGFRIPRRRGNGSGSGSGSGELSYTVSRSSGSGDLGYSGGEFARGLSHSGSRSSSGDNAATFERPNRFKSESPTNLIRRQRIVLPALVAIKTMHGSQPSHPHPLRIMYFLPMPSQSKQCTPICRNLTPTICLGWTAVLWIQPCPCRMSTRVPQSLPLPRDDKGMAAKILLGSWVESGVPSRSPKAQTNPLITPPRLCWIHWVRGRQA